MILKEIQYWRYKGYALHFILWGGLMLLNYFIFGIPGLDLDFTFSLGTWMIYILLFYLNYSLLIPKFLFNKKYALYVSLLVVSLTVNLYLKRVIDYHFFEQMAQQENLMGRFNKPFPPMMLPPGKMILGHTKLIWDIRIDRFFMPGISQLSLIILASTSLCFVKRWQDDEKLKVEIEKEKISTELSFLKQQINPHFLFNAINSIYSLAISQMPNTADAIIKLSSILRYMLYETDKKHVALNEEISAINNYIELQKLRLTEKVDLQFLVDGNVDKYRIVPLIMLPLIENAFKHGVDNANSCFIRIVIEVKTGDLNLTITNKIVSKTKSIESSGIGIKNIIRRLDLLYPKAYTFKSTEENDVFKVILNIKLEQ